MRIDAVERVKRLPDVVGTREIAESLGLNRDNVTRLCQAGRIPAKKAWYKWVVAKADLLRLLEQGEWQKEEA